MKICVIGAGTMGSGIAQVFAAKGHETVLCDISQEFVDRGLASIAKNLDRAVQKGKCSEAERDAVLANIKPATVLDNAKGSLLVIEAIVENMEIKQKLFKDRSQDGLSMVYYYSTNSIPFVGHSIQPRARPNYIGTLCIQDLVFIHA